MASSARIDELKQKFDENPRRYFAPLANEFRKVGDLEQAILICEAYLPQQPGHMSGHIVYGQALFESNRLDEALGVFQTALSLDPENLIALRHLGDIAARQGDTTSARRWYERVLEADPRNEEIQGLIGGLAEATVATHEPPAPEVGYVEPAPAPPVAPPEAYAAAPDAHFATPDVVEAEIPELLDLDVTLPESAPAAAAPAPAPEAARAPEFESTSEADFDRMPETRDLMPEPSSMAEGFESTEFTAPSAQIAQEPGLQSAFEDETGVSGAAVAPLPGLEATPGVASPEPPAAPAANAFPELEEPLPADEELVLPPHGDSMAASAPPAPAQDDGLLDFDMPVAEEAAAPTEAPPSAAIPAELPPEVIAAEAELVDAAAAAVPTAEVTQAEAEQEAESVGSELSFLDVGAASQPEPSAAPSADAESEPVQAAQRPFVTETMAELYLKQGFRTEALAVYEQLSAASPSDQRLVEKVASLRTAAAPSAAAGPPVREFFARFASRRPWERAAAAAPPSDNDFDIAEPEVPTELPPLPPEVIAAEAATITSDAAPAAAGAEEQRPATNAPTPSAPTGGSIDALFGNRQAGPTEDSAASALSQAFGGTTETPPIPGNPARQATGELSLDSVFREGGARGPRNSQGFSFDQFFSQGAEGDRTSGGPASQENPASGEPAERTADDIEQFNSWLQGLKQR
jgi:tetratricopeptide (TPR) repeat protein